MVMPELIIMKIGDADPRVLVGRGGGEGRTGRASFDWGALDSSSLSNIILRCKILGVQTVLSTTELFTLPSFYSFA